MGRQVDTVWVLGAGFSKPLGGPLLKQLFTKSSCDTAWLRFPKDLYPQLHEDSTKAAQWLYHCGCGFPDGPIYTVEGRGERLWDDAEQFLDKLDAAAHEGPESPNWQRLSQLLERSKMFCEKPDTHDLKRVAGAARRMLAAECSAFLDGANLKEERWQPYVRWARQLTENDAVVTFNYDLVLEKLERARHGPLHVRLSEERVPNDRAQVLKLHGSIDWQRHAPVGPRPARYELAGGDFFALKCSDDESAIASPGPSKLSRTRELEPLWDLAEFLVERAKAVVFVGYRFPPTDAEARRRLLEALGRNPYGYKAVHTVLGPQASEDTARLGQLLHWTLRQGRRELSERPVKEPPGNEPTYNLVQHQLYAEDFFSVCNAGLIQQPYRWPE